MYREYSTGKRQQPVTTTRVQVLPRLRRRRELRREEAVLEIAKTWGTSVAFSPRISSLSSNMPNHWACRGLREKAQAHLLCLLTLPPVYGTNTARTLYRYGLTCGVEATIDDGTARADSVGVRFGDEHGASFVSKRRLAGWGQYSFLLLPLSCHFKRWRKNMRFS
ncbi:hypothetical protein F5884DRAFT_462642 [Xylogone sp. PMI_703]|nr:hypothetical protein F5884DRAFT_462642 [Xylogone sp. PMI_703]